MKIYFHKPQLMPSCRTLKTNKKAVYGYSPFLESKGKLSHFFNPFGKNPFHENLFAISGFHVLKFW